MKDIYLEWKDCQLVIKHCLGTKCFVPCGYSTRAGFNGVIVESATGDKCPIPLDKIISPEFSNKFELKNFIKDNICVKGTGTPGGGPVDPEVGKIPLGPLTVEDPDNPKECLTVFMWNDEGEFCFTWDQNGNDIINNFNELKMIESKLGQAIVQSPLIANEFPYKADGLVLCLDETDQDIVGLVTGSPIYTDFVAEMTAKYPPPTGATYGLSKISIEQFSGTPKRNVYCDIADAVQLVDKNTQVNVVGLGNTSLLTVGGLKHYGKAQKPIEVVDADGTCKVCTDATCELVTGDVVVNGLSGNAIQIDFCISCYAAAPVV